MRVCCFFQF